MNNEKAIVLVLGRICSGKGTFAQELVTSVYGKPYTHIATSDVVKKITGSLSREQLQQTSHLDQAIADQLLQLISEHPFIVIDGIRQTSIIQRIMDAHGQAVQLIWLEVPKSVRETRYLARKDSKDTKPFNDAEAGDIALGINDVEQSFRPLSRVVNNF